MRVRQLICIAVFFWGAVGVAFAESPAEQLAQRYGCMACHHAKTDLIGPSFSSIAAKYRSQPGIKDKLILKLKNGGSGVWGAAEQPAYANEIKVQTDYSILVDWVLSH